MRSVYYICLYTTRADSDQRATLPYSRASNASLVGGNHTHFEEENQLYSKRKERKYDKLRVLRFFFFVCPSAYEGHKNGDFSRFVGKGVKNGGGNPPPPLLRIEEITQTPTFLVKELGRNHKCPKTEPVIKANLRRRT